MSSPHILQLELGTQSYPIVIGAALLGGHYDLAAWLSGDDCLIVSNETVAPLYREKLRANLGTRSVAAIDLPDGEQYKTAASLHRILDCLADMGANRDTTVIALGGGVVGDVAGFAASIYMRGVNLVQVPTTLLSQVDSSVGGKTGINHARGKNLIGAFYQPRIVLIDTQTLQSLPLREFRAGLAEVIKYGAIADLEFFAWLEVNIEALLARDAAALAHAIRRSCELKAQFVIADERESGQRALLNFGHTFGHAIEHCMGYGQWLHGEAVAAGMVMASALSGLPAADHNRLCELLQRAGLPTAPPSIAAESLRAAMGMDKKVLHKKLRFVLLQSLGSAFVTSDYDDARLAQVLEAAH